MAVELMIQGGAMVETPDDDANVEFNNLSI